MIPYGIDFLCYYMVRFLTLRINLILALSSGKIEKSNLSIKTIQFKTPKNFSIYLVFQFISYNLFAISTIDTYVYVCVDI